MTRLQLLILALQCWALTLPAVAQVDPESPQRRAMVIRVVDDEKKPVARPNWRLRAARAADEHVRGVPTLGPIERIFSGSEVRLEGVHVHDQWILKLDAPGFDVRVRQIQVLPITDPFEVVMRAPKPAGRLALRLVDIKGRPVDGLTVDVLIVDRTARAYLRNAHHRTWLPHLLGPEKYRRRSDHDGRLDVPVPGGKICHVVLHASFPEAVREMPNRWVAESPRIQVASGEARTLTLVAHTLNRLATGQVLDPEKRPVAGAFVGLVADAGDRQLVQALRALGGWQITTDEQGAFSLWFPANISSGRIEATVENRDAPGTRRAQLPFIAGQANLVLVLP